MRTEIVDGIPVFTLRERFPGKVRIRVKKKPNELSILKIPPMQRMALQNLMKMGPPFTNEKKKEAAMQAGYKNSHGNAVTTMDRLLQRKPIVNEIEKKIQAKHKITTDEKIAEVLVDCLDANHPLAKGDKPDWHARIKGTQEINKVTDNYPPKKIQEDRRIVHLHLTGEDFKQLKKAEEMRGGNEQDPNPFR